MCFIGTQPARQAGSYSLNSPATRLGELSAGRLYVDQHNLPCPRPLCIKCRKPLPLRTISIGMVNCRHCGKSSKIALGTTDTKILYPDDFTGDEREFAREQGGVRLSVRSSSAFGDLYLANVCGTLCIRTFHPHPNPLPEGEGWGD